MPRREGRRAAGRAYDRMLPKFAKSREDDTSILTTPNPAPFRFRSRRSSRSREKFARRSRVALRARDRAAGIAASSVSALLSTCFHAASAGPGYRPSVSRNNGFRTQGLPATIAFFPRLDRSSLAAPPNHRLVSRATVAVRASTWKPYNGRYCVMGSIKVESHF